MEAQENLLHGCRVSNLAMMCLLVIEYVVVFYDITFSFQGLMVLAGYGCLSFLITCNSHGRNVRVRYEQELSLMLKSLIVNFVMFFFLYAVRWEESNNGNGLALELLLLSILQIISIWVLCTIGKKIARNRKRGVRLYFWEEKPIDISRIKWAESVSVQNIEMEQIRERIAKCDEVYLCDISVGKRNDLLKICLVNQKPVYFTSKISDMELRTAGLAQDGDTPVFYYGVYKIGKKQEVIKRIADVVFSVILLLVLSPLFVLIAIAIKMEDGGEVFYRQIRCTKNQRQFTILKFRSMVSEAESETGVRLAENKDKRITRTGYFLRKFKLDELPQLINILKGDMSFVGPRPERPELIEEILKRVPEFTLRTQVPAGLTGYAQVHGDYHTDFLEKLKWDLMYIENYSLLLDLKIILMTIPTVLRGSGDIAD